MHFICIPETFCGKALPSRNCGKSSVRPSVAKRNNTRVRKKTDLLPVFFCFVETTLFHATCFLFLKECPIWWPWRIGRWFWSADNRRDNLLNVPQKKKCGAFSRFFLRHETFPPKWKSDVPFPCRGKSLLCLKRIRSWLFLFSATEAKLWPEIVASFLRFVMNVGDLFSESSQRCLEEKTSRVASVSWHFF